MPRRKRASKLARIYNIKPTGEAQSQYHELPPTLVGYITIENTAGIEFRFEDNYYWLDREECEYNYIESYTPH